MVVLSLPKQCLSLPRLLHLFCLGQFVSSFCGPLCPCCSHGLHGQWEELLQMSSLFSGQGRASS